MPDPMVHPETAGESPFAYGPWTWREPMRGEHFRRCSFCGSIHPEDLAAEASWRADWADRKYGWPHKFYVDIANRDPDALFVIGSTTSSSPPVTGPTWTAWEDLTADELAAAKRDGYGDGRYRTPTFVYLGKRPAHHAKFYTIHLRDADLDSAVKATIERVSGLAFEFLDDGRVSWRRASGVR